MKNPFARPSKAASPPAMKSAPPPYGQHLAALQLTGDARWTPSDFNALSREGYGRNPVAYRCIRMISEAAASVTITAPEGPAAEMMRRSHTQGSLTEVLESFYGYLQLSGNAYLEAVLDGERPVMLRALRPDRMSLLTDKAGRAMGWAHKTGGRTRSFRRDMATNRCAIFHIRLFNPADDCFGQPPMQAAAQAVDIHNQGGEWAKGLLDNSARPSGALIYQGRAGDQLTDDQFDRLKTELETNFTGAKRAGRPMVLEGGLDWKSMSLSPSDMDFIQTRREAARDIALAFGVPPMLLGLPGDNTYANYHEANQAFWRQTIIPLVSKTARGLQGWLRPFYGDALTLTPDLEHIPALSEERAQLWARLSAASFITDAERRVLAGLETGGRHE